MKILYVNNYQGSRVVSQRGHRRNRTLGPSRKVELVVVALASRGHQVDVVSPATVAEHTFRTFPGFECHEVGCGEAKVTYLPALDVPRLNLLYASRKLRSFLRSASAYDAVVLYNLEWLLLEPVLEFVDHHGCPVVVEYEDDAMFTVGTRFKAWHLNRGRRSIEAARRRAGGVIAVSPELARQLGIANSIVLPGAVGDDLLTIERPTFGEEDRPLNLIYSGGMSTEKGVDILARAVGVLDFPVELQLIGQGRDLGMIRELVKGSRAKVSVPGEVNRGDLIAALANAHVAVNPHRMTSGMLGQIFPFKVVDYIGAGLPVVTSRLGEFPLPYRDSLITYEEDTPESLAGALRLARERLAPLQLAAQRVRRWVAEEYSLQAVGLKLDTLLERARERC